MPRLLLVCLFFSLSLTLALAQDSTIVLSTSMFTDRHTISLSALTGWVYQAGHNPVWATQNLNTTGWTKRQPRTLSAKDADANGKAEGWFRLRIRLDSTFKGLPLGLSSSSWAASEVYVNGQWTASFGSTGTSDKPYAEPILEPPLAIQLEPGKDYLIAIHVVDQVVAFPPFAAKKLKSQIANDTDRLIWLSRPEFTSHFLMSAKMKSGFATLWFAVSLLLASLFWLLSTQELPEKNTIRLWAIVETFFAITNLFRFIDLIDISFTHYYFGIQIIQLFLWQILSLFLIAYLRVFGYHIQNKWIGIGGLVSLAGAIADAYIRRNGLLFNGGCLCELLVFVYVIIASRKRLKGALWAIGVGGGFTILFASLLALIGLTKVIDLSNNEFFNYLLLTGALLSLPLSFLIYLALRFKETLAEVRANAAAVILVTQEKRDLLASQNERLEQQVEARTAELKASQQHLIQKEKMASLGELTAGIAHEIQNPLNFVNNFSEVSTELVGELKEEAQAGRTDDVLALADDLTQNLEKITLHGQRASSIVKGMLEHSRTTTGERQPTDLNALADEYLRLSYHGLRAKDKEFNSELLTDFDSDLGKVEVVPQEIGRVLLNLYNNAFYAVHQKQKTASADYQPTVKVSTTQVNGQLEIRVGDNGTGMRESVKAKIFQPFFTTKPTGEGTGLGLSLSYDIITKGHGGALQVDSKEGEFTEFVITLPAA